MLEALISTAGRCVCLPTVGRAATPYCLSFELFEYYLVHLGACLCRCCCYYGNEPPFSILRAARRSVLVCAVHWSTPPVSILPEAGCTVLCARARRVMESSSIICVVVRFRQVVWLRPVNHIGYLNVFVGRFVECRRYNPSAFTLRSISVTSSDVRR